MKTALILPVYNEESTVKDLIERSKSSVDWVICVDDGSSDNSYKVAQETGVIVVSHPVNLGKAAALKTGVEVALLKGAGVVVFMDSDGQHLPEDLPRFIQPIKKGECDIVMGYREGGHQTPLLRKWGNSLVGKVIKLLFGFKINDILCGYRAFRTTAYKTLKWESQGYQVEAEMTIRAVQDRLKYKQIPIKTIYHDAYKGMNLYDGIKLLLQIVLWRLGL